MTSNSARRTVAPTTMTTPMSTGRRAIRRVICYKRVTAGRCAVRPSCAEVVS